MTFFFFQLSPLGKSGEEESPSKSLELRNQREARLQDHPLRMILGDLP